MKNSILILLALAMIATPVMAENAPEGDHLTVASTAEITGDFFSTVRDPNAADIDVRQLLHGYKTVCRDPETGLIELDPSVVAGCAVSYNSTGDRVYTIALADDLYASDGSRITAENYVFSLLLSASGVSGAAPDRSFIVGMDDYANAAADTVSGIRLIDETTFSVTVSADAYPYFYETEYLDITPYPIEEIVPDREVVDEGNGAYIRDPETGARGFDAADLEAALFDPETGYASDPLVVCGPYTLVSYDRAESTAEFAVNEYYKGDAAGNKPSIAGITYKTVSNAALPEAIRNGEVDLAVRILSPGVIDTVLNDGEMIAKTYPRSGLAYIRFNTDRAGVAEAAVRKAMYMCLDKERIIADALGPYAESVDAWYGKNLWVYQAAVENGISMDHFRSCAYDTGKAAELLETAGWTVNADGIREKQINGETIVLDLKLVCYDGSDMLQPLSDIYAPALREAGIRLTVEAVPTHGLYAMYSAEEHDCDMILASMNFSRVFDPALSHPGMDNAELYEMAVELRNTNPADVDVYCRKWVSFEEKWLDVLPAMPLYTNLYYDFHTPELTGYPIESSSEWTEAILQSYTDQ